jgi:hypothetical protein
VRVVLDYARIVVEKYHANGSAIRTAVDHNLALQFARLGPAVG